MSKLKGNTLSSCTVSNEASSYQSNKIARKIPLRMNFEFIPTGFALPRQQRRQRVPSVEVAGRFEQMVPPKMRQNAGQKSPLKHLEHILPCTPVFCPRQKSLPEFYVRELSRKMGTPSVGRGTILRPQLPMLAQTFSPQHQRFRIVSQQIDHRHSLMWSWASYASPLGNPHQVF